MRLAINQKCFLRLYNANSPLALPVASLRHKEMYSPPLIFVPGELYSIYLNTVVGVGSFTFFTPNSSFNVGYSVIPVAHTTGTHSIIEFTGPDIPNGIYKIAIGAYVSNGVEVIRNVNLANDLSAFFRFSHNKLLFNYYYPYISNGYKQRMRLRISAKEIQPETNIEGYERTNTGKFANLQGVSRDYVMFETPDYSNEDHQAASLLTLHDNIFINDVEYIRKPTSPYRVISATDVPVSNGEFGLYDNSSMIRLFC